MCNYSVVIFYLLCLPGKLHCVLMSRGEFVLKQKVCYMTCVRDPQNSKTIPWDLLLLSIFRPVLLEFRFYNDSALLQRIYHVPFYQNTPLLGSLMDIVTIGKFTEKTEWSEKTQQGGVDEEDASFCYRRDSRLPMLDNRLPMLDSSPFSFLSLW